MAEDLVFEWLEAILKRIDKDFSITVIDYKKNVVGITASNIDCFSAFFTQTKRKECSTVREAPTVGVKIS